MRWRRRDSTGSEGHLEILLADLAARNEEIRQRTDHEHRSYLSYFTSMVTVLVAIAAATRFGSLLTPDFQRILPTLLEVFAIFLLWLPLDAINEQLRIRLLALYIERELRPAIATTIAVHRSDVLRWEPFQSEIMISTRSANTFISAMHIARSTVGYAPALLAMGYFLLHLPTHADTGLVTINVILLAIFLVVAAIPLVLAWMLARSPRLTLDDSETPPPAP